MKQFCRTLLVIVLALLLSLAPALDAVADLTVTMLTKWESLDRAGNTFVWTISKIVWDSSYPTGGESVTAADFGVTYRVKAIWKIYDDDKYIYNYDEPGQKFMILIGDYNNGSDGPLIELADQANMSGLNTTVMTMGW